MAKCASIASYAKNCKVCVRYKVLTMYRVVHMPLDDGVQRMLRATIRRWAKALRDAGHNIPEE